MAGLKNGSLLAAAESAGFDVLITADQHIPDQQRFQGRKLALLVLVARRRLRWRSMRLIGMDWVIRARPSLY
jgi:hypothetical protein